MSAGDTKIPDEKAVVPDSAKLADLKAFEELVSNVPKSVQRAVATYNTEFAKSAAVKVGPDVENLNTIITNRLSEFRLLVTEETKRQVEASFKHDSSGLFRMLKGIQNYMTLIAKIKFQDPTKHDAMVASWRSLYNELYEMIAQATNCPEQVDVTNRSFLTDVETLSQTDLEQRANTLTKNQGLVSVKNQIKYHFLIQYQQSSFKKNRFISVFGIGQTGKSLIIGDAVTDLASSMRDFAYGNTKDIDTGEITVKGGALNAPSVNTDAAVTAAQQAVIVTAQELKSAQQTYTNAKADYDSAVTRSNSKNDNEKLVAVDSLRRTEGPRYQSANEALATAVRNNKSTIDNEKVVESKAKYNAEKPPSDFLTFSIADAVDLRRGEEATPSEIVANISHWLTCASSSASGNDIDFESMSGNVNIRRMGVLHIRNFDHLFMNDNAIRNASDSTTRSFATEQASRAFVASKEASNLTTTDAAGNSITLTKPTSQIEGASLPPPAKQGGKYNNRTGGLVGDTAHKKELTRLLVDFLRPEYQQKMFPNVWVIFSMRYEGNIPKEVRDIIGKVSIRIDLPDENFRRSIIRSEWNRIYMNSWVNRVLRLIRITDDVGLTVAEVNGKLQYIIPPENQPKLNPFALLILKQYADNSLVSEFDKYQKQKIRQNDYRALESWLTGYIFSEYQRSILQFTQNQKPKPNTDEAIKMIIRKVFSIVEKYIKPVWDLFTEVQTKRRNEILMNSGLLDRLVAYTGMGLAGFCMLERVGIPDDFIRDYLRKQGRVLTTGKFGFGLNLSEMYEFTHLLETTSRHKFLLREVQTMKRYLNDSIYATECSNTVQSLRWNDPTQPEQGWSFPSDGSSNFVDSSASSERESDRVRSKGKVLDYESTQCAGSVDMLDLPIINTTIDYYWDDYTVDTVIAEMLKQVRTKKDYVDFVREWFFSNPHAKGLTVKESAQCRAFERDQQQNAKSNSTSFTFGPNLVRPTAPSVTGTVIPLTGRLTQGGSNQGKFNTGGAARDKKKPADMAAKARTNRTSTQTTKSKQFQFQSQTNKASKSKSTIVLEY